MTANTGSRAPGIVLRLDNNEGARLSEEAAQSLSSCAPEIVRGYPSVIDLERRIADRFLVDPGRVVVAAGADDAIDRCFRVLLTEPRSLILTAPTFQQFHRFAASTRAVVREVAWLDRFPVEDILEAIDRDTALVAFATPNNPTGRIARCSDLERIATAMAHGIVLLDHAYVEYGEDDLTEFATQLPNVVTVRTFSKAWGLAGCRVGFAIAPASVARALRQVGNPYPVSGPSIEMVTRRLQDSPAEVRGHVTRVRAERESLETLLSQLGIAATPSRANFVFADFGDRVTFVHRSLAVRNIAVRAFPDRSELAHGLRISLPDDTPAFDYLTESLRVILDPDVLLFDMDGVLADVSGSYDRCVRDTVGHFGAGVTDDDIEIVSLAGSASNDWVVVQRLLSAQGRYVPLDDIRAHFQFLYEGSPGHDGYVRDETALIEAEMLSRIAGERQIGVVTGRPRAEAVDFLKRFGLDAVVRVVVCSEDGPGKPNPAPVRLALGKLGLSRAWMIGDTPDDIVAALEAGVLPIGVVSRDKPRRREGLMKAGAAAVIPDVQSLRSYLP